MCNIKTTDAFFSTNSLYHLLYVTYELHDQCMLALEGSTQDVVQETRKLLEVNRVFVHGPKAARPHNEGRSCMFATRSRRLQCA